MLNYNRHSMCFGGPKLKYDLDKPVDIEKNLCWHGLIF